MQEVIGSTPIFSTSIPPLAGFFVMAYTLYILYSAQINRYYVGYTEDLNIRINQHNSGLSTYTAKANDWVVVYTEKFANRDLAMNREKYIKAQKSRKFIEELIKV